PAVPARAVAVAAGTGPLPPGASSRRAVTRPGNGSHRRGARESPPRTKAPRAVPQLLCALEAVLPLAAQKATCDHLAPRPPAHVRGLLRATAKAAVPRRAS